MIGLLCLGLFIIMHLMGCTKAPEVFTFYQEGTHLIGENNRVRIDYLQDVVDYCFEPEAMLLFVLHEARGDHKDMVGYEAAVAQGLRVGGFITVYKVEHNSNDPILEERYTSDFTWVNPWQIDSGDFEGDGNLELFVACYRATEFYPVERRPFIVTWDGEKIIRKWTGSYIGDEKWLEGNIKDMNEDGKDELVLRVVNEDGQLTNRHYQWDGFGFDALSIGQ